MFIDIKILIEPKHETLSSTLASGIEAPPDTSISVMLQLMGVESCELPSATPVRPA